MLTQMDVGTAGLLVAQGSETGPESIDADYSAPWMTLLSDVGGWIIGTVILVGVILLAIAAVIFAGSKSSGMSRGQEIGVGAMLWIGVAMLIVGSAGGIISWFTDLELGF